MMYITRMFQEVAMSDTMVRKQIYIPRRQEQLLKRLAKERGVSEAEVIRQALDHEAQQQPTPVRASREALEQFLAYAESLRERPEMMQGEPVRWTREELYAEREARWLRDDDKEDKGDE
jgi:hypothetical protein